MRIIIAGAGEVGFHLAKLLAYEKQDIVLIDLDQEKLDYASNHLDCATVKGNSTSYEVLQEAIVNKADLFIAVTSFEETNLASAIIAKKLGALKTIARISNLEFFLKKDILDLATIGVDELISPESLAAREIKRLLTRSTATDTFEFDNGMLTLLGITIDESNQLNNKSLKETAFLNPDHDYINVAILRNGKTIVPHGSTKFRINDHAYFIAQQEGVKKLLKIGGREGFEIKNVMIMGGSKIGFHAARRLSKKYNIKLVEKDRDKSFELADKLPDTLVVNGDCSNVDLLKEEGITDMDAFVAVTGNSETNIISCLLAKNLVVKKTIALVENMDYIHISQNIGVDTMINKKLIAANFISRYVRQGQVISLTGIHGVEAEIMEFEVPEKSKITDKAIKKLNFPKSAIIGGVIRNGEVKSPTGDFQIQSNDRVVVLCLPECIHQVEKFFN
ncbi:MAG: Trk system potassium transporter TrkA [Cyclobacteriaceae bacterium]|nr:Trk system potassium transporter TrkA [Cyclobacteriaceae bacterium]